MDKGNHFLGQPGYRQLIKSLKKAKITEFSIQYTEKKYVKEVQSLHKPVYDAVCHNNEVCVYMVERDGHDG